MVEGDLDPVAQFLGDALFLFIEQDGVVVLLVLVVVHEVDRGEKGVVGLDKGDPLPKPPFPGCQIDIDAFEPPLHPGFGDLLEVLFQKGVEIKPQHADGQEDAGDNEEGEFPQQAVFQKTGSTVSTLARVTSLTGIVMCLGAVSPRKIRKATSTVCLPPSGKSTDALCVPARIALRASEV